MCWEMHFFQDRWNVLKYQGYGAYTWEHRERSNEYRNNDTDKYFDSDFLDTHT